MIVRYRVGAFHTEQTKSTAPKYFLTDTSTSKAPMPPTATSAAQLGMYFPFITTSLSNLTH